MYISLYIQFIYIYIKMYENCVKIAEAVHWILSHLQESYSKRWSCCHCVLKTNLFENSKDPGFLQQDFDQFEAECISTLIFCSLSF